ncbi:MAG: isoprenylcysteine carboxylmethyltransferase family protein [Candidatus Omnitrophica bacterium]|nr:isoprenylcysteine carboxylmethyltransferase family protein [Candidatus Omnitrophota bacterium]
MKIKDRVRRLIKPRFAVMYPFFLFAVFFANCDERTVLRGIWFIAAGLFMRIWANGYAVKSEKLTTSGPYAFVRHPLYLGTMFLVIGFIVILNLRFIGALFFIIIAAIYYRTVKKEEGMLRSRFAEYLDYSKKVPALFPSFSPYRGGEKWPFSLERLIRSQEYKMFIWTTVIIILFYLKYLVIVRHEGLNRAAFGLMAAAFLLVVLDLTGEFLRHNRVKGGFGD